MQYLQSFFNSLEQLPNTLSDAYKGTKNGLNTLILLLVALAISKVLFGVLEALHSIPLLPSAMELVGTGYTVWFSYKYLYSISGRARFLAEVERIKTEIFGQPKVTAQLPESNSPLASVESVEELYAKVADC